MTTTFKMPEPHRMLGNDVYGKEYPCYTAEALRDVLEQAERVAFSATCGYGDDYAYGYNKAAAEVSRAIRAMIKEIK